MSIEKLESELKKVTAERDALKARNAQISLVSWLVWIRSAERGEMSFEWCCEQVGIDPDWIRLRMNSNELLGRLSDVYK